MNPPEVDNKSKMAFPLHFKLNDDKPYLLDVGLTKREYIAIACLQGLLASNKYINEDVIPTSIALADELLKELNKDKE